MRKKRAFTLPIVLLTLLITLTILVSLGSLSPAPSARAAFPGQNGPIAYAKQAIAGRFNIWVMDLNGNNKTQITTSGDNQQPSWSVDGTKIVFVRDFRHLGDERGWLKPDKSHQHPRARDRKQPRLVAGRVKNRLPAPGWHDTTGDLCDECRWLRENCPDR